MRGDKEEATESCAVVDRTAGHTYGMSESALPAPLFAPSKFCRAQRLGPASLVSLGFVSEHKNEVWSMTI